MNAPLRVQFSNHSLQNQAPWPFQYTSKLPGSMIAGVKLEVRLIKRYAGGDKALLCISEAGRQGRGSHLQTKNGSNPL